MLEAEALYFAPGFAITSIFSMEPAGIDFKASDLVMEEIFPLIITVTFPWPLKVISPSGSIETEGILFKISVAVLPADEMSFSTLKTILLGLNSTAFFSPTISTSPRISVSNSISMIPKFKFRVISEMFRYFVA